jgi:hypothetical protein
VSKSIIGWDLSKGAGSNAKLLDGEAPGEILLFQVPADPVIISGSYTAQIDICNLDPRLTIAASCYFRVVPGLDPSLAAPLANMPATIKAQLLARSANPSEGTIVLYDLPTLSMFGHAGALPDGCEISSAATGIRLVVSIPEPTDFTYGREVVATLVAIPNVTLACAELAEAIVKRLSVTLPDPIRPIWTIYSP